MFDSLSKVLDINNVSIDEIKELVEKLNIIVKDREDYFEILPSNNSSKIHLYSITGSVYFFLRVNCDKVMPIQFPDITRRWCDAIAIWTINGKTCIKKSDLSATGTNIKYNGYVETETFITKISNICIKKDGWEVSA